MTSELFAEVVRGLLSWFTGIVTDPTTVVLLSLLAGSVWFSMRQRKEGKYIYDDMAHEIRSKEQALLHEKDARHEEAMGLQSATNRTISELSSYLLENREALARVENVIVNCTTRLK